MQVSLKKITRRRLIMRRKTVRLLIFGLIFGLLYTGYLNYQNHRAHAYYESLRQSDPVRYLDDLRQTEGFDSYLKKYRLLEGYNKFKTDVPPFLVGRWTMKSAPERIVAGTSSTQCPNSITFEQGLIELARGGKKLKYGVEYSIYGKDMYLRGTKTGSLNIPSMLKISMVIYVNSIDHLELVPPGQSQKYYAYRCGS
ncbi:MAG: hypothetical protein QM492_09575 [Rhodobacterales bacterium]